MRKEFTRTARKSYMVVREANYVYENFEMQMILRNRISTLLEMQMILGDGEAQYWYDVTGMQSLEKEMSLHPVSEKQLKQLLQAIVDAKIQLEEYLLDDICLVYEPDMIFYDRGENRIRFCYIPGYAKSDSAGVEHLLETILQRLDHSDSGAVRIGYDMYERCMKNGFLIEDCRECIGERSDRGIETMKPVEGPTAMEAFAEAMNLDPDPQPFMQEPAGKRKVKQKKMRRERKSEMKQEQHSLKSDYPEFVSTPQPIPVQTPASMMQGGQTAPFMAEEMTDWSPTECFEREPLMQIWELVYMGTGLEHNIRMTKFPFLFGKDAAKVDGELLSRTISRIHARISEQDGILYLEDYNSTNGTYHNGKMIPMNTPCRLKEGDQIIFATEEFKLERRSVPVM